MEVILAESAGFCFGVERAVQMVDDKISEGTSLLYTYGPIIHNDQVTDSFKDKGVSIIDESTDLDKIEKGTIVIRSHGVSKKISQNLSKAGFLVADATCPFVQKIHREVQKYSAMGHFIIIIGNVNHPEVKGITGWCEGPCLVAKDKEEIDFSRIPIEGPVTIVAQTTFRLEKFKELVDFISEKRYHVNVLDTICDATQRRQEEAAKIAGNVDVMLVIGGQSSSNTKKLYEICSSICDRTYFLQTAADFDSTLIEGAQRVGITAGASTPNHIIKEVQKLCLI